MDGVYDPTTNPIVALFRRGAERVNCVLMRGRGYDWLIAQCILKREKYIISLPTCPSGFANAKKGNPFAADVSNPFTTIEHPTKPNKAVNVPLIGFLKC